VALCLVLVSFLSVTSLPHFPYGRSYYPRQRPFMMPGMPGGGMYPPPPYGYPPPPPPPPAAAPVNGTGKVGTLYQIKLTRKDRVINFKMIFYLKEFFIFFPNGIDCTQCSQVLKTMGSFF
jgi:hypothetical protein